MFIKIILLAALIRLLIVTGKPLLCAGIYAGVVFFFGLVAGHAFVPVLIGTALGGALAALYFGLLHRFGDRAVTFYLIAAAGLLIGLV